MEERRRFFRLDDEVIMDFHAISSDEFSHWKDLHNIDKSELKELEQELGTLLHQIRASHPVLGQVLELFNRKINLSPGHNNIYPEISLSATEARVRINLSACGMSFRTDTDLRNESHLLFNLQLKPSNTMLSLAADIVAVEETPEDETQYLVRVNFDGLKEAEQELLIQHLFQLQSRTLRHQRDHQG